MSEFVLYCFAQSGNAYKPALMLSLCGADWTARYVDYFGGETRQPEYRARNVMGEVPILEHKGRRLTQSAVILLYLARELGRFGPQDQNEEYEILRWLFWDNHRLTGYVSPRRFLLTFRKTGETPVTAFFAERMRQAFEVLETHMTGRDFVLGPRPTIADISLCGYLFWPEEYGVSWDDYPAIKAWLSRISALPGWQHPYDLMPGHPLSAPGES